jgi:hypothetical protein
MAATWPVCRHRAGDDNHRGGLVLGAGTILAKCGADDGGSPSLALAGNEQRVLALLTIAYGRTVNASVIDHIRRAAQAYMRGETNLALIHLAYTGLSTLDDQKTASYRLFLANELLKAGMSPRDLLSGCGLDPAPLNLLKAGFNPDEPRVPAGNPDGGQWTYGEEGGPAPPVPVRNDSFDPNAVIPVADFSGGFHDTVVQDWLDALKNKGIPAIAGPAIRFIGPDGRVQGYLDLLIHEPGQAVEAYEVKTGANPTFTSQQMRYIPMLQVGGHVYSTDPRIADLGLTPGVPFPPMRVGVIYTPGPGQRYVVKFLPGPFFAPGP